MSQFEPYIEFRTQNGKTEFTTAAFINLITFINKYKPDKSDSDSERSIESLMVDCESKFNERFKYSLSLIGLDGGLEVIDWTKSSDDHAERVILPRMACGYSFRLRSMAKFPFVLVRFSVYFTENYQKTVELMELMYKLFNIEFR